MQLDRVAANASRTVTVRSDADVNNLDNNFNIANLQALTTQANGAGDEVAATPTCWVPMGTDTADLAADWEGAAPTVSFLGKWWNLFANSVFKQNPASLTSLPMQTAEK